MPPWELPQSNAMPEDDFDEVTATQAPDYSLLKRAGRSERAPSSVSGVTPLRRVPLAPPTPPAPPVRLLDMEALRALLRRFTDDAGPAARALMLREVSILGARPETFPLLLSGQLVAALGQLLDDAATRRRFLEDAHQILRTST